ncbi:hypothetical protein TrCOL_g3314 [Triparma columacea]|uniref:Alpha-ketoglutarate-dependent dioxygenase FTO n=1 Tax=Triparma columacea TaxID=722753 RepID=A0A9W7GHU8_9STRA|nr:hypothetical protein TrCOL_g3314 [Triparma columacea]
MAPSATKYPINYPQILPAVYKQNFLTKTLDEELYNIALKTCFKGCVIDPPSTLPSSLPPTSILSTLQKLSPLYQSDVTQPFGLGTPCAKTYVTRCLLGERGTTYKYLGLRMFSSYWGDAGDGGIKDLNEWLEERTKGHLAQLTLDRSYPTTGSNKYTVALINRMSSYSSSGPTSNKLKKEPDFKTSRTNVSWHADSSLQNFSSIAVYQAVVDAETGELVEDRPLDKDDMKWRVALKVVRDAEGPTMNTRGANTQNATTTSPSPPPQQQQASSNPVNPTVALPLDNNSSYYLLDDFNHHHQHAVLSPLESSDSQRRPPTVRYSSTHRLIRKGGHVDDIIGRVKGTVNNFNKKGTNVFRNELQVWVEVETEWIRQFYIQGEGHKDIKWKEWGGWIKELVEGWEKIEGRILSVLIWVRRAAMGRRGLRGGGGKEGKKIVKALKGMKEVESRGGGKVGGNEIYELFAEGLERMDRVREGWRKRVGDQVFNTLEEIWRPMDVPLKFGVKEEEAGRGGEGGDEVLGVSRLPETGLKDIAECVRGWGNCYAGGGECTWNVEGMPEVGGEGGKGGEEWEGWGREGTTIGLEMQKPWAGELLGGRKNIETRRYKIPKRLMGRRVEIMEVDKGTDGVSTLPRGDALSGDDLRGVRWAGWATFVECKTYESRETFEADEGKHLVKRDSGYGWKEGQTEVVYGWRVGEFGRYGEGERGRGGEGVRIERRLRSLFEVIERTGEGEGGGENKGGMNKGGINKGGKNKGGKKKGGKKREGGGGGAEGVGGDGKKKKKKKRF